MASIILPSEEQLLQYFEDYKVPRNILQHCLCVQKTALFLAKRLKLKHIPINVDLVLCAALLHDLFKAVAIDLTKQSKFHSYQPSAEELAMWKQLREKYPNMYEG